MRFMGGSASPPEHLNAISAWTLETEYVTELVAFAQEIGDGTLRLEVMFLQGVSNLLRAAVAVDPLLGCSWLLGIRRLALCPPTSRFGTRLVARPLITRVADVPGASAHEIQPICRTHFAIDLIQGV